MRRFLDVVGLDRDLGELLGRRDRADVVDAEPLVRGVDEAAGAGRRGLEEAQRGDPERVAGGLDHLLQRDAGFAAVAPGRPAPAAGARAAPTPTTLATPGTPMSRGRMVQRARTDMSIERQLVGGQRRRCITRLDEDSGWSIARRLRDLRQRVRLGEALGHDLAGADEVGPGLEDRGRSTRARRSTRSGSRRATRRR